MAGHDYLYKIIKELNEKNIEICIDINYDNNDNR